MAMHHNKCPKIESIRKNPPSCTASDTGEDSCPKEKNQLYPPQEEEFPKKNKSESKVTELLQPAATLSGAIHIHYRSKVLETLSHLMVFFMLITSYIVRRFSLKASKL
ncbi:hypothetical protein ATANTOWER_016946 [Ataeniobius toweri]|uniref:Uncharacterized protein n=1 Tax=Ataeniobius toweri TaxID=208326 RepID=A0ABU7BZR7_9TELE|nr:hypothetical protein [Ataeniobius toweri]